MDWESSISTKGANLSNAERARYREKGLCFNCGEGGHISRTCPEKGKNHGTKNKSRISTKKAKTPISPREEHESSDPDSDADSEKA
jgi:hypothetical protein